MSTSVSTHLPTYILPADASPKLQRVYLFFKALNELDYDKFMENFDPELEHVTLPSSLGKVPINYEEFKVLAKNITANFKTFEFFIREVIESEDGIAVFVNTKGLSATGIPWETDRTLFVYFAPVREGETLPRVKRELEMLDSVKALEFYATMKPEVAA